MLHRVGLTFSDISSAIFCHLDVPYKPIKIGVDLFIVFYKSPFCKKMG